MKKIFFFSLLFTTSCLFAQNSSSTLTSGITTGLSTEGLWVTIFKFLFEGFFYIVLPLLLYGIGSYSIGLLDKHYHKKTSSRISWVPFARYYYFIKKITQSSWKAFIITILPWIITIGSMASFMVFGIIAYRLQSDINSSMYTAMNIFAILALIGAVTIIVMSFWRAFIISKYVKGDTTTTLGLSTYTALVLWYIALNRVYKKTDIIGIVGFSVLVLIVCYYVGIFIVKGFDGVARVLGA